MARTLLVRNHRSALVLAVIAVSALLIASCTDNLDWAGPRPGDEVMGQPPSPAGEYEATITRTTGNVAHIVAADLPSLAFGQGWASAEDRACDLADQVVKINSERARFFGPGKDDANIDSDFAWAAVGIRDIAEEDWNDADDRLRDVFKAYTSGWNAQIEDLGTDNITDWCAGEEWVRPLEPVEVYAYARSIALLASSGAIIDMIGKAQPPSDTDETDGDSAKDEPDGPVGDSGTGAGTGDTDANPDTHDGEQAMGQLVADTAERGSNGWAIGSDNTEDAGAILLANPHFPWEGELRFWEVQLTIPGEIDMYGVQLSGIPGIGIGFGEHFGWTHTVSAGNRMTAYTLDLVEGSTTSYRYGDETRDMTSHDETIEVLGEDGELSETSRTLWRSHYGPIVDFPGVGWNESMAVTVRDANIDNDEFITQYIDALYAQTLDDLIELNRTYSGVPLFNTIAASDDGRVWYADTSATPNLSTEAQDAYLASLETNFLAAAAADSGAVLLDGSDPLFEWQDVEGARDPGLVRFDDMPMVTTNDYVFNANDSFWMAHATDMIEGDYSILHGRQRTSRSPRTRQNATVLEEIISTGDQGTGTSVTLDMVADAALANHGYTSAALKDQVVERCRATDHVDLDELAPDETKAGDQIPGLPSARIDLAEACEVLAAWDGSYDVDSRGALLWREFVSRVPSKDLTEAGSLWAEAFDPEHPVETPRGLAEPAADGVDATMDNLARAVQVLERAGVALDAPLGEQQFAYRNGMRVPVHGGNGADGVTNVVTWSTNFSTMDPFVRALRGVPVARRSSIIHADLLDPDGEVSDQLGYPVTAGTSFLLAVDFTASGPVAKSFLTYGNTADRSDPSYTEATEMFSHKDWKPVFFRPADVEKNAQSVITVGT